MSNSKKSNSNISFTEEEFKFLSLFEGEEKIIAMKELLSTKSKLAQSELDAANVRVGKSTEILANVISFAKDLALAIVNGADKIPAVFDSYSKLKEMELENQKSEN